MDTPEFNPFEDRLSRDLRNDLSEALVKAIETGNRKTLDETIERYNRQQLASSYAQYLENRKSLYEKALVTIDQSVHEPISRAAILWDLGLFFEVHEILEHTWYDAEGDPKMLLQALIRAAGVYIKLEFGFSEAAHNIAKKALPILEQQTEILEQFIKPEVLITALRNLAQNPPKIAKV